jgi:hypothetical protein
MPVILPKDWISIGGTALGNNCFLFLTEVLAGQDHGPDHCIGKVTMASIPLADDNGIPDAWVRSPHEQEKLVTMFA